jgi:hypothetical protein
VANCRGPNHPRGNHPDKKYLACENHQHENSRSIGLCRVASGACCAGNESRCDRHGVPPPWGPLRGSNRVTAAQQRVQGRHVLAMVVGFAMCEICAVGNFEIQFGPMRFRFLLPFIARPQKPPFSLFYRGRSRGRSRSRRGRIRLQMQTSARI